MINKKILRSLSNETNYPDFCLKATLNTKLFSSFRKNEIYCQILEHVTRQQGQEYINEIILNSPDLFESIELFKKNDIIGDPKLYEYPEIGYMSPTTLRYVKVLSDLIKIFANLDKKSICEIGVGYGGQCRIIDSYCDISDYTLVDLKPVLMLSEKYLDNYIIRSSLNYKTMNELKISSYDLIISNYAFTELSREIQDVYLKKIILNSKGGYIAYNDINPFDYRSYKKEELLSVIPNSRIIPEKPLTHPNNCIIIWNN